eukprot:730872-Prorocentrum_minimum.AAC.3
MAAEPHSGLSCPAWRFTATHPPGHQHQNILLQPVTRPALVEPTGFSFSVPIMLDNRFGRHDTILH